MVKKIKNTVPSTYVISDLNDKEIVGTFYGKELLKKSKKNSEQKKYLRKKEINYMSSGKRMTIHSIAGLIKKTFYEMSQYFTKPYNHIGGNVKVELDLFSYATKTDLKGATVIDTPNLALKSNLAKLKAEVDKINVDKLKTVPADLSKLSN